MTDLIAMHVEGLAELKAVLRALPRKIRNKVVFAGLRAGAALIRDAAKAAAPRKTGAARRAITIRSSKVELRKGNVGVFVGVRREDKRKIAAPAGRRARPDPYYWWWQEFGWTARGRSRRGKGASIGTKVPGKKFLSDAAAEKAQDALNVALRAMVEKLIALDRKS